MTGYRSYGRRQPERSQPPYQLLQLAPPVSIAFSAVLSGSGGRDFKTSDASSARIHPSRQSVRRPLSKSAARGFPGLLGAQSEQSSRLRPTSEWRR